MSKKFIDGVKVMSGIYDGREWSYNDYIFSIVDHYEKFTVIYRTNVFDPKLSIFTRELSRIHFIPAMSKKPVKTGDYMVGDILYVVSQLDNTQVIKAYGDDGAEYLFTIEITGLDIPIHKVDVLAQVETWRRGS